MLPWPRTYLAGILLLGLACRASSTPVTAQPPTAATAQATIAAAPITSAPIIPNPLVSRGKRVFGLSTRLKPEPTAVNDGAYKTFEGTWNAGSPTADRPAGVAIEIGLGPRRLLLCWSAAGSYNYNETDYGSPGNYRIETSADSRTGADGTWKTVASVAHVSVHAAEHAFDFTGQRWVRFVVTSAPSVSPNGVQIDEIDVHDVSAGVSDVWFFMGDSITAFAFDRLSPAHQPSFAEIMHRRHPRYFPAMINGGIGGEKSDDAVSHIDDWLAQNPDARYWALGYGTNDAWGNATDPARFKSNMQTVINRIRGAGRTPVLAKIPFASDGQHKTVGLFNQAIDELNASNALLPGPDLFAWFLAHPDELKDGVHPTDKGIVSINRLWAAAMDRLYAP